MENDDLIRVFESIGFSKNESIVYLDLLKSGKSSPSDISKRTKIHRSNTYDILETLVKKGIIDESNENGRKIFYPANPKDLLDYIKQKEEILKEALPRIEEIRNKYEEETKLTISEGVSALKSFISHLLDEKEEIDVFGTPAHAPEKFGGFLDEFHRKRVEEKIPMRHIFSGNAIKRIKQLNKMPFTEARYFPSSYDSKISTTVCGKKVMIKTWEDPIHVIYIENKKIAQAYKNYFEILWNEAIQSK